MQQNHQLDIRFLLSLSFIFNLCLRAKSWTSYQPQGSIHLISVSLEQAKDAKFVNLQ